MREQTEIKQAWERRKIKRKETARMKDRKKKEEEKKRKKKKEVIGAQT